MKINDMRKGAWLHFANLKVGCVFEYPTGYSNPEKKKYIKIECVYINGENKNIMCLDTTRLYFCEEQHLVIPLVVELVIKD